VSRPRRPPAPVRPSPRADDKSPARACPICGRPATQKYAPFCSARCADVDLYRWLNGKYAIPAAEADEPGQGGEEEEE
jgi:hypothetical protein